VTTSRGRCSGTIRRPIENPKQRRNRRNRRSTFHLPLPEDRSAIQAAIGQVLQRIASNDIDPRRAGLLLYGLQIASLNLPKPQSRSQSRSRSQSQSQVKPEPETVEEITIDPTLGVLAPRAELSALVKRKSVVAQLIENILRSEKEEEKAVNSGISEVAAVPAIVPILQATEDDPDIAVLLNPTRKTVNATSKLSFRPKAAHLPPQWRNSLLPLPLPVLSTPMNLQQAFTASIPVAAQLQNPKFSSIHTP
jgi:hypothetical protein